MASEITLDALLARQAAMNDVAARLQGETDVDRIQAIAAELAVMGRELEEMARTLEAQHAAAPAARGWTEVVLTAAQRERILAATGVALETIRVPDEAGIATRIMPSTDPRIIEHLAMREAEKTRDAREAQAQLRTQLAEAFAGIEAQGNDALREQLERMKSDPKFLGVLLGK